MELLAKDEWPEKSGRDVRKVFLNGKACQPQEIPSDENRFMLQES